MGNFFPILQGIQTECKLQRGRDCDDENCIRNNDKPDISGCGGGTMPGGRRGGGTPGGGPKGKESRN